MSLPYVRQIGMVFQRPNPFPKSIFDNVAYGLKLSGVKSLRQLEELVEQALRSAALVGRGKGSSRRLCVEIVSGAASSDLVIARAIALEPQVLLLDEPASSLDPISTLRIEELIYKLKHSYTIIIVTHICSRRRGSRDYTAFMNDGRLVEFGITENVFTFPEKSRDRGLHHWGDMANTQG